ncbi:MAG: PQQ-dependent sugar dehydrogenase [Actinomycetota bacterium]|nr:PQQ-dependent sugar dehydrogenase [Actinomycetota bacterium]
MIAACLRAPWGLAVMADGQSALVGERTTGRILRIAPQTDPVLYATMKAIDAGGDGGLLGIAPSPSFDEDGLIYLYVTTETDNRVFRLAKGDAAKPIFVGIPKGSTHNGGRIEFGADGQLYVGTGDTGRPALAADPESLAGKVLRIDEFGKPSQGNPAAGSAIYASGFTDVTGMCRLGSTMGALDHRPAADVLIRVVKGGKYTSLPSGTAVWTWKRADGGANDCSMSSSQLAFTSLDAQRIVGLQLNPKTGGFVGAPNILIQKTYGRLLTLTLGGSGTPQEVFWATTSNKDGNGKPTTSDDRVIVLKANGGGGRAGKD